MRTQSKSRQTAWNAGNSSDQVAMSFSFLIWLNKILISFFFQRVVAGTTLKNLINCLELIMISHNAIGKFTAWRVNSTLNSRQWIFLDSNNWIKKKKEKKTVIIFFCFYPARAPQKAISKSTVRTIMALANKRQGRTRWNLRQLYLFVFKLFKQASHYLKDNSGILSVRIS